MRPHRHSACPGSVTKRSSQQKYLWRGDSCHTANQSLHPVNNYLPALCKEDERDKYSVLSKEVISNSKINTKYS